MAAKYLVSDREQWEAEQRAYAAGLDAARDAVAGIPSGRYAIEDACAAIDALRGES